MDLIGTEHLLLGALRQHGAEAVDLLATYGVTYEAVGAAFEGSVGVPAPGLTPGTVPVPRAAELRRFAPEAGEVVLAAIDMAGGQPGVVHLLIAILEAGGSTGPGLLGAIAAQGAGGRAPVAWSEIVRRLRTLAGST